MISTRLSEDEYVALQRHCAATGARSVSDLTRDAIRTLLKYVNREDMLSHRMDECLIEMRNLDRRLATLAAKIPAMDDKEDI
jgi:hypothetical protein